MGAFPEQLFSPVHHSFKFLIDTQVAKLVPC